MTNTGASVVNGDLGVSPGTAITGFPPGTVNGATHAADAVAIQAQSDLTTAYNDAAGRTPVVTVAGDLGGETLTPGVYNSNSSLGLTGALTLNAQGDPNAVFIFRAGSTLTTASASNIALINGAQACNVYWQVGSSATLGTTSVFVGNILANTSISMDSGVTVSGRALARNGAVTLIDDTITASACAAGTDTTTTGTGPGTAPGTAPGAAAPGTAPGTAPGAAAPGTAPGTAAPGTTRTTTTRPGTTRTTTTRTVSRPGTGRTTVRKTTPPTRHGTAALATVPHSVGAELAHYGTSRCVRQTFRIAVTGRSIRRVAFSLGNKVIARPSKAPFQATVAAVGGIRVITARVTFKDATRAKVRHLRYRACAAAALKATPPAKPVATVGFTG